MFTGRTKQSILLWFTLNCISNIAKSGIVEDACPGVSRECLLTFYENLQLTRRYPVKIGHITKLALENEQVREMKTLSIKPPVFEIPNFLSAEECDDIINLAKKTGLHTSSTIDENNFGDEQDFVEHESDIFEYYDYNKDDFLDVGEVLNLLDSEMDFIPDREDIIKMFDTLNLDKNGDLKISLNEYQKQDVKALIKFVVGMKRNKPYTRSRNSNQTWLETNKSGEKTLQLLRKRLQKLTQLPMALLNASESLQVVSYSARGHYNCHMDSEDIDLETKCCHLNDYEHGCRICRYLTVLYFLNDVEEGGETAFPVADNETFNEDVWEKDMERVCNVGHNCYKSNLRVQPEKGKAILWYNHKINNDTGWMGEVDSYSHHGGCGVKKGMKWIANNWITVSESRTDDIEFWVRKLLNPDSEDQQNLHTASSEDNNDEHDVFDEVLETTRKEEEINEIFDRLEDNVDHGEL